MKTTLTFDLPEEREEFENYYRGPMAFLVLWHLDNWLRDRIKYDGREELQPARDELRSLAEEYEISIS